MRYSRIPVLIVRQNIFQCLCLMLLSVSTLSMGNTAESLNAHHNRQQFPNQKSTDQNHQDDRQQFPNQRRGSGTH